MLTRTPTAFLTAPEAIKSAGFVQRKFTAAAAGPNFNRNEPMHVLVVEFLILPAHVLDFATAIAANAAASLTTEPGCRRFDVCRDPQDPLIFLLYELYDDELALQAHLQSAHFAAMERLTAGWVRSKSVRRLQLC